MGGEGKLVDGYLRRLSGQVRKVQALHRVQGDGAELADARQEVAILILEAIREYDPAKARKGRDVWVLGQVVRRIKNRQRDQRTFRRCGLRWIKDSEGCFKPDVDVVARPDPEVFYGEDVAHAATNETPEDAVLRDERRARFGQAIADAEACLRDPALWNLNLQTVAGKILASARRNVPAIGDVAAALLRLRVSDAIQTGTARIEDDWPVCGGVKIPRGTAEALWRLARDELSRALVEYGELTRA